MNHYLHILIIFLMLIVGQQETHAMTRPREKDKISVVSKHNDTSKEAVLSDSLSLLRVCSTCPQRIIPVFVENTGKIFGRIVFYISKPQSCFLLMGGSCRLETAPFQSQASCDYYIFALRHLLC